MVACLKDVLAPLGVEPALAPGTTVSADSTTRQIPEKGELLHLRASSLMGVRLGGAGLPGISGMPVHFLAPTLTNTNYCFIRKRIFAVIRADGSIVFRAPILTADDLVENGLCIRKGKNLQTWTPRDTYQLEVVWRILLQAYWSVSATSVDRPYRLWSEWAAIHTYRAK